MMEATKIQSMLTVENVILAPPGPGEMLDWREVFGDAC
jgi:hypothetical protein